MTNKEAIEHLNNKLNIAYFTAEDNEALDMAIKALEEQTVGKWIKEESKSLEGMYRCSECGRRVEDLTDDLRIHAGLEDSTIADIYPFCHCGAKMKGAEE